MSKATNFRSDKHQKPKRRNRQTSEATNLRSDKPRKRQTNGSDQSQKTTNLESDKRLLRQTSKATNVGCLPRNEGSWEMRGVMSMGLPNWAIIVMAA